MDLFNDDIAALRDYVSAKKAAGREVRLLNSGEGERRHPEFLEKGGATIVLTEDTWLELGHPGTFSLAPALVTDRMDLVNDGAITLIGPDIPETRGRLPFAQILLIASDDIQDESYRKINTFQYELELRGYMIKAVPSSLTIWSRISKGSAGRGFSFEVLGSAIIAAYKAAYPISSMEMIFVTSSTEDVEELKDLHRRVTRIIGAMDKMMEEMSFDCTSCEYLDVCGDVRQLGALRDKLMKQKGKR